MIVLPEHLVDLSRIDDVVVSGRGGKEQQISALLPAWKRSSSALYDYEVEHNSKLWRLEIKKQQNLQWFDSGKYHLLNEQNRDIVVLFVNHIKGSIETLAAVQLGNFMDLLMSLPQYRLLGWTEEVMSVAAEFKVKYPSLQFKAKAKILTMMQQHPDLFQVIYRRPKIVVA